MMKDEALKLAKYGFAVFPLKRRRKTPIQQGGFKNATTQASYITDWWTKKPQANIGIACGQQSGGLCVIDIDVAHADEGIDGRESLREWEEEHGKLPETVTAVTGSGGMHLYYRVHKQVSPKVGLLPGIDIRCDGSYVVAPGSIHENGNPYFWDLSPDDYEIAEADDVVWELLNTKNESAEGEGFKAATETVPEGQRTNYLFRLTASLQSKGLGDEAIKAAVRAENEMKCRPPLTESELNKEVFPALKKYNKGENYDMFPVPGGAVKPKEDEEIVIKSAAQLQAEELPPIPFFVDNLVAQGTTIIVAKSKMGKSWFALQMACAVAEGKQFLGRFNTHRCGVLYLDLECNDQLMQSRLNIVMDGRKAPDNLYITHKFPALDKGFAKKIDETLSKYKDIGLIIIDVLKKIKPSKKNGKDSDYDVDYENLGTLNEIAQTHKVAVLILHHSRKMVDPDDPFSNALGSTALQGSTDTMIALSRKKRFDEETDMFISTRLFREQNYKAKYNNDTAKWSILGDEREYQKSLEEHEYESNPIIQTIRMALSNHQQWHVTATELAEQVYFETGHKVSPDSVGRYLKANKNEILEKDRIDVKESSYRSGQKGRFILLEHFALPGKKKKPNIEEE